MSKETVPVPCCREDEFKHPCGGVVCERQTLHLEAVSSKASFCRHFRKSLSKSTS